MKKIVLIIPVLAFVFSSCNTARLTNFSDDVYNSPTDDIRLAKIAAAEKAKQEAADKQKLEEEKLAQKAKDDANPYYKDPQYSKDDYYDYQYASKVRRFNNPVQGAGYYDNYYTNAYSYNQNPGMYGTSIYNSYNYLMPSNQYNNYSNGLSFGYNSYGCNSGYNNYNGSGQYINSGYNNYGYNSGYGYNPYGYNGYSGYGYNSYGYNPYGYSSGFGNSWGYFNSYDVNSSYSKMTYGARGNNGGGNAERNSSAGMLVPEEYKNDSRQQFFNSVAQKQQEAVRFTEVARQKNPVGETGLDNINMAPNNSQRNSFDNNSNPSNPSNTPQTKNGGFWPSLFSGNSNTTESTRSGNKSDRTAGTVENPNNNAPTNAGRYSGTTNTDNSNSGWNSSPSGGSGGSSGGSSPRGNSGGGGGTSSPR